MAEKSISALIKEKAIALGFDACGFSEVKAIEKDKVYFEQWIEKGYHAKMDYMERNTEKRFNPALLVDGAHSIISLALNYYPDQKQDASNPQIAYYAYGKDYHEVMKLKMQELFEYIKSLFPNLEGRIFCDTAPVLERYWATNAGLGFIGKNTMLIIPGKGSYFFLGQLITNIKLEYDNPIGNSCGKCQRCIEACPTKALETSFLLNSNKCISYQTIENKNEIDNQIIPQLSNCFYGCDICQKVCPWNRFAKPHNTPKFSPSEELLSISASEIEAMTETKYQRIFKGSAIKRAKFGGLKRNIKALKEWRELGKQ